MNNNNSYPYLLGSYETAGITNVITNATPIGTLSFSASGRNPYGYVVANGEAFDNTLYPDLQLAIQNNYANTDTPSGSFNGTNDYKIPNLTGSNRFPMASDLQVVTTSNITNLTAALLYGGASNVTLAVSNLPPHEHQTQQAGGTSLASGSGNRTGDPNTGGPLTYADIYDSTGTKIVQANGTGQTAVNIRNPFTSLYALVHSTSVIPSYYQTGCVNIDATNNRFWVKFQLNGSNITNGIQVCTLQMGAFTPVQMLTNLVNALSADELVSGIAQTFVLGSAYSINSQGRYVYKIYCGTTGAGNPNSVTVTFDFTQANGTTIPQAVLDKTADTLGYYTRSVVTYNVGALTTQRSYIAPPKAMKIYFGCVEDGSMSSANLPTVTNSF